ncbi:hypothetical protein CKAN_01609200 [Cinnamomum micranthum f. kanehirae]|uniref:Uncharacterized protein n=1 Tax=Cinnamomum micranthum f. kanehirae TaxID=337451 RepID=A0A443P8N3_9MAGN|nr:hypothetical protein CKAN_01609200 [Cinnamomum micranthum f. kanehirae]
MGACGLDEALGELEGGVDVALGWQDNLQTKPNQTEPTPLISSTNALKPRSEDPPSATDSLVKSFHFLAFFFISSPPITTSKHLFSSPPSNTPSSFTFTLTPALQTSSTSFAFVI